MEFQNPYELFDIQVSSPEEVTPALLRRIRKKILAEFELSGATIAQFNGQEMDKSTALGLAEQLEDPSTARNFFYLGKHPDLVRFLESGSIKDLRQLAPPPPDVDRGFKQFVSRQMAPIVDQALLGHFRKTRWAAAIDLLKRLKWIDEADMDLALKSTSRQYKQSIRDMEETRAQGAEALSKRDLSTCFDPGRIDLLNMFPEMFQGLRNQYGLALKDYALDLHNEAGETERAYRVATQAAELKTDFSTQEKIRKTRVWLYNQRKESPPKTTKEKRDFQSVPLTESASPPKKSKRSTLVAVVVGVVLAAIGIAVFNINRQEKKREVIAIMELQSKLQEALKTVPEAAADSSLLNPPAIKIELPKFDRLLFNRRDTFLAALNTPLNLGGALERPKTGTRPYKDIFNAELGDPIQAEIVFYNDSDQDLVVMLETMAAHKLYQEAYVRSGERWVFEDMPTGFYYVVPHVGTQWLDSAFKFHDTYFPGFAEIQLSQEPSKNAPSENMVFVSPVLLFEEDAKWRDKYIFRFDGEDLSQEKITKYDN